MIQQAKQGMDEQDVKRYASFDVAASWHNEIFVKVLIGGEWQPSTFTAPRS